MSHFLGCTSSSECVLVFRKRLFSTVGAKIRIGTGVLRFGLEFNLEYDFTICTSEIHFSTPSLHAYNPSKLRLRTIHWLLLSLFSIWKSVINLLLLIGTKTFHISSLEQKKHTTIKLNCDVLNHAGYLFKNVAKMLPEINNPAKALIWQGLKTNLHHSRPNTLTYTKFYKFI